MIPSASMRNLILVLSVVAVLFSTVGLNSALGSTARDDPNISPTELSDAEYAKLVGAALRDSRVQDRIQGKAYEVSSYDFIGNVNDSPFVWYPEVHINVGTDEQVTVVMDKADRIEESTVKRVEIFPLRKPAQAIGDDDNHGFATNYYTGGSTINGIRLSTTAPTIQTTQDKGMAFLLNAIALNSNESQACNAAYYGSTYFGQVGFIWAWNGFVTWSDTATNCVPQFPAVTYSAGKSYDMKIYTSGGNWILYAKNNYTGEVFTKTRSGITYVVFKTSNYNTSVFLESQISSPAGSQFTTYPAGTSTVSTNGGSTWFNWQSGGRNDQSCTNVNHIYPYDSSKEVISGNLASGGSASWNTVRMATNYPAC